MNIFSTRNKKILNKKSILQVPLDLKAHNLVKKIIIHQETM